MAGKRARRLNNTRKNKLISRVLRLAHDLIAPAMGDGRPCIATCPVAIISKTKTKIHERTEIPIQFKNCT
ncbi:MAG: hypothetical protein Q6373_001705 [Candidatus Sigynarchaeota archaeon]